MDALIQMGINFVLFLQSLGGWLVGPMKFFTFLGTEEFYLFAAPALYWCLDARLGLRMGLALMVSGAVNSIFKLAFTGPRPYWVDPRVIAYSSETSFGIPSGHAQNAVVVWGMFAAWFQRTWAWIVAVALMFLIGISRPYLGVHFPHDTLVGWLIGALLLWAFLQYEERIVAWLARYRPTEQIVIALAASLFIILAAALVRFIQGDWTVPAEWVRNATAAAPDADPIAPLALSGLVSNAGVFFGLACGAIFLRQRGSFDAGGALWQRGLRFLVGLVGVYLIWAGLGAVFPRGETLVPFLLRYLRYALIGAWISALAPLLFVQLKLARPLESRGLSI